VSRPRLVQLAAVIAAALACSLVFAAVAAADTFVVNTTADVASQVGECEGSPGDCSLRQAIDRANGTAGDNTIEVPAGHYGLTIEPSGGENESGDLDVDAESLVIAGAGAEQTVIDAGAIEDRVFYAHPGATLVLLGVTVTGGQIESESGGGILAEEAILVLADSAVEGNVAREASSGGGISLIESQSQILLSTIAGNRNSGDGGGIYAEEAELLIADSTIANNVVETSLYPSHPNWGAFGGGAEINENSKVAFVNSTIAGNRIIDDNGEEPDGGGAALEGDLGEVTAVNTLIYGNTGTGVDDPEQCDETLESLGHNLEGPTQGGETRCFEAPTDLVADPLLAPLANYGGETDTIALYEGSPAIDAGDSAECPELDQRGVTRPVGGGCDIGAWEGVGIPLPSPPAPPAAPKTTSPPALPRATISAKGKVVVKAAGKTFKVQPGITVSCPTGGAACAVTLKATAKAPKQAGAAKSAKAKPLTIGSAKLSVPAGSSKALSFKLTKRAAKLLTETGKLATKIEVSASIAGVAATATKSAKLKPPKAKAKSK